MYIFKEYLKKVLLIDLAVFIATLCWISKKCDDFSLETIHMMAGGPSSSHAKFYKTLTSLADMGIDASVSNIDMLFYSLAEISTPLCFVIFFGIICFFRQNNISCS